MAGFFGTDYFTSQAEVMRSAVSDEEINLQLDIVVPKLHHNLHLPFAAPKLKRAPAPFSSGKRAYASSTTRNGEAQCSSSFGHSVTEAEEDFLRSFLAINLKPAIQERECDLCRRIRPLTEFISTEECAHLYCTECCKRHVEREILTNTQIECPHPNCRHNFDVA